MKSLIMIIIAGALINNVVPTYCSPWEWIS